MQKKLDNIRHSLAHLLASAFLKIDPKAKLGIGPTTENGFYYDFLPSKKITEDDLPKLEEIMRDLIKQNLKFVGKKVSFSEAQKIFKDQPFKLELLRDLKKYGTTEYSLIQKIKNKKIKPKKLDKVTIYQTGDFIDLCRGGHVKKTSEINPEAFKLIKIAGAYWRGDEKNPMLVRIYGVAFENKEDLDKYLEFLEIQEKYNHRVLGEKLKIFLISEKVGKGLSILMPNGEKIKNILMNYMREKEEKYGYLYVSTPVLAKYTLYEASGHLKHYLENMYHVSDPQEPNVEYFVKPMNCPHHHMVYLELVKSYRDLPLRLAEAGQVYRVEKTGELYGLMRVRGPITQNDSHIYVNKEKLEEEFNKVLDLFFEVYNEIKVFQDYWFRLSLPDFKGKNKEKFGGDLKSWKWASKLIANICKERKLNFVSQEGEAAFYGPKLDIQIKNIFGKEETLATIQIDILVPKRMNLTFINKKGKEENPIIIHRAILGSYERFIGFLLEQTRGNLPLWLAPIQVVFLPINEEVLDYTYKVKEIFDKRNLRTEIWGPEESLNKRILLGEENKIPYMIVIGEREKKNNEISIRKRGRIDLGNKKIDEFLSQLDKEIKEKLIS